MTVILLWFFNFTLPFVVISHLEVGTWNSNESDYLRKMKKHFAKITQKYPENAQNQKCIVYTSYICLKACVYQFSAL